jgi:RHS repeat-associated protein
MIRFCASGCGSGEDWTYMYDADDERTWLFKNYQYHFRRTLRDLGGKVLRDYFTSATTSAVEDYVYRDGQLLGAQITQNGVAQPTRHFSLDHLDTPRLITTSPGAGSGFYTLTPCRILDTRQTGVPLTQTNPQQVYQISGVCGVPANAVAVAFNVTLVGATTKLSMQGYAGDLPPPGTNVVSATPPNTSTIAGFAVLPLATNGSGTLGVLMTLTPPATSGQTDLILDVTGYFAPTSAASVVAYHAYFPDGLEATYFAQDSERMKFTGHERDLGDPSSPADDLDYMHARHYSMLTGRFLSVDLLEGDPIAPQSFNLYGYVGNQPLTVTDQAGLSGTPVGEAPDFYYLYGDTVNAVTGSWQFAPGVNTGLWGLGALQAGSLQFQNSFGAGGGPVELGLMDRILSSIPIQSNQYGECVREHRAHPEYALAAFGSAVPKALVPPFREIGSPRTTPASVVAFGINRTFQGSEAALAFARGLRAAGAAASWVFTPLTVAEGAWDWGALIGCAVHQ